jgi:hypothetical protein
MEPEALDPPVSGASLFGEVFGTEFGDCASSTITFIVFFDARTRASSFELQAVAVTASGDTVGMPDLGRR